MAESGQNQDNQFDIVLLGGGTGGYVAAIRAKQLGFNVAVVEAVKLGGTCLHRGCIPTKAMLKSASVLDQVKESAEYGVTLTGEIGFEYKTALERSLKVVEGQYRGLQYLFDKKHKIPVFMGRGKILDASTVEVTPNDGGAVFSLKATDIIINTGSRPRGIKGIEFDGKRVFNSDHSVVREDMPKSVIVRGGGATGVEWADIYHRYGAKVTLVGRIVPQEDAEVSQHIQRAFQRKKLDVIPDARPAAEDIDVTDSGVTVRITDSKGKQRVLEAESLFVAIGRQGNVENIGLENVGVTVEGDIIPVDSMLRTNVPHIYAIGDVNGQQMLAHTAMHHGIIAVEHIAGKNPFPLDVLNSASCTYCEPEIGSVGLTESQAKELGYEIKIGKFPMKPNAKATIEGHTDGFTKLIVDADTDDILGVHIVGPHATELIAEAGLARFLNASVQELATTVHPHPTVSEVLGEAAHDALGHAIHI
ncbi:MAG TPA: dihydrolipoyl dehydrogenase [Thermomicrobiales bacterium]|nr:dihydrolipoyl dehydrogenase [Thermomicrobiales bacterium]